MVARILFILGILTGAIQADIVVVVGQDSSLKSLSRTEVRQLFLNNRGGGPVAVEGSPNPLYERFYSEIAGKTASQLRAYRARQIFSGRGKPPRKVKRQELERYLGAHPDAVTYIDAADLPPTLKVVFRLQ